MLKKIVSSAIQLLRHRALVFMIRDRGIHYLHNSMKLKIGYFKYDPFVGSKLTSLSPKTEIEKINLIYIINLI